MIGRKDLLKNLQPVGPYTSSLLNGSEVFAFEQGSVCVSKFYSAQCFIYSGKKMYSDLPRTIDDKTDCFISLSTSVLYRTLAQGWRLEWVSERI